MFRDANVSISVQMYEISAPTIFIQRLFGLLPITVQKKGSQLHLKWSLMYVFYSIAIGVLLPVLTYKGILEDIVSVKEESVKIKSHTDMYVIFCDASVVQLVVFFSAAVNSFGHKNLFGYIRCLSEVDSILIPGNLKTSKKITLVMIFVVLSATISISIADIFMYFKTMGDENGKCPILKRYLPFYIAYLVMLMSQYKFWFYGRSILRRLLVLNELLENSIQDEKQRVCTIFEISPDVKYIGYITDSDNVDKEIRSVLPKSSRMQKSSKPLFQYSKGRILKLLSVYVKLCDAVNYLNRVHGISNAITIIDILWHLIESPYHLLRELSGSRRNPAYITMMVMWCFFHFGRLLILVEPCHSCRIQVDKMKTLITKLQCTKDINSDFKEQLETLSTAISQCKLEFSAGGLATIDRPLVTALLGTITTYLVILLQYQNS